MLLSEKLEELLQDSNSGIEFQKIGDVYPCRDGWTVRYRVSIPLCMLGYDSGYHIGEYDIVYDNKYTDIDVADVSDIDGPCISSDGIPYGILWIDDMQYDSGDAEIPINKIASDILSSIDSSQYDDCYYDWPSAEALL